MLGDLFPRWPPLICFVVLAIDSWERLRFVLAICLLTVLCSFQSLLSLFLLFIFFYFYFFLLFFFASSFCYCSCCCCYYYCCSFSFSLVSSTSDPPPHFSPSGTWASCSRTKGLKVGTSVDEIPSRWSCEKSMVISCSTSKWGKLPELNSKLAPENQTKLPQKEMKHLPMIDFMKLLLLVLQRVRMMVGFLSAEFLFISCDAPHDKKLKHQQISPVISESACTTEMTKNSDCQNSHPWEKISRLDLTVKFISPSSSSSSSSTSQPHHHPITPYKAESFGLPKSSFLLELPPPNKALMASRTKHGGFWASWVELQQNLGVHVHFFMDGMYFLEENTWP